MKRICCLLFLSFCGMAATILLTSNEGEKNSRISPRVSRISSVEFSCRPEHMLAPLLHHDNPLALSRVQQNAVTTLMENYQSAVKPLLAKIVMARETLHDNIRAGKYSETSTRFITDGLVPSMTETLMERERLDAGIYMLLTQKQRKTAKELLRLVEKSLSERSVVPLPKFRAEEGIKTCLPLTDDQARKVNEIIESSRHEISFLLKETENGKKTDPLSYLSHFDEKEARKRARQQARKMSAILLAAECVTEKVYELLHQKGKNTATDSTEQIEYCVMEGILKPVL